MSQTSLPDYHFLLIAPNLGAEWYFEAARAYWERFRPIVVSDLSLISIVPDNMTVSVTVVARRDLVAQLGVELSQLKPEALFDPVVFDFIEDAQMTLEQRAQSNQPFGVSLIPTETPTAGPTAQPLYPTPGPVGPNAATLIPTPDLPDQSEIDVTNPPQTPIFPTPGPITGSE